LNNSSFGAYINDFISMGLTPREWILEAPFTQTALIQSQHQPGEPVLCIGCLRARPILTSPSVPIHQVSGKIIFIRTEHAPAQTE